MNMIARYLHWLHLRWPAGTVEKLPECDEDGRTTMPGVTIVGDLAGVPLLKFALESGARAARRIATELRQTDTTSSRSDVVDVLIVGGGVAGMAAAIECSKARLDFRVIEGAEPFATVASFPAKKPIFTYPTEMEPTSTLQVSAEVKEGLLDELRAQAGHHDIPIVKGTARRIIREGDFLRVELEADQAPLRAQRVIIALGRSGNHRRLGVAGETRPHVLHRLIDPAKHSGERVVVVGGGDSAAEAALALTEAGARVTLVHRGEGLTRVKPSTAAQIEAMSRSGHLDARLKSTVVEIAENSVVLKSARGEASTVDADRVLVLIGRDAPLEFFRASRLPIRGERRATQWLGVAAFALSAAFLYAMKAFGVLSDVWWHPSNLARSWLSTRATETSSTLSTAIAASASNGIGFYITLLYCIAVVVFGVARIRRRRTPYVFRQTLTLMLIQCLLLFVLPEILLPWFGRLGAWDDGIWKSIADALFPLADYDANGREYWRAYGFVLAWPLFVWNVFTAQPHTVWLIISCVQTFVIIPLIVWRWGKGAYCGWICSCGALAETMGDRHREKMPHGRGWNRLNALGQVLLLVAFGMLLLRVTSWTTGSALSIAWSDGLLVRGWKPVVDFALAGALGTGLYFGYSGRLWCRFACPLAALMHIYGRFSRFRIIADGKKCISCSACTATCHQGSTSWALRAVAYQWRIRSASGAPRASRSVLPGSSSLAR
ncbi:MAG: NAD(P)-binding domain-containing protein [Sandaracinaceae bacterium]|nr:NAD(P)-binding domain-containing protein [Sandaracinaceae bacterium]